MNPPVSNDRKGLLFVLSGPAGSGKDTVLARYFAGGGQAAKTVSATTRPKRPGETEGIDYFFLTPEAFAERVESGRMLEYTEYAGNRYGTLVSEVERLRSENDVILKIEVEGGQNVRRRFPDAVLIFLMPPDVATLKSRLVERGTEEEPVIRKRLSRAEQELEIAASCYDYLIVNDSITDAAERLSAVICAEHCRIGRYASDLEGMKADVKEIVL